MPWNSPRGMGQNRREDRFGAVSEGLRRMFYEHPFGVEDFGADSHLLQSVRNITSGEFDPLVVVFLISH